jgi:hypothetical protein
VYAICADAPDGKVRLVMRFCEKGSLDSHLTERARHEVGHMCPVIDRWVGVACAPAVNLFLILFLTLLHCTVVLLLPRVA